MGWDSLQTELAPWLGVKRAFFSVWEEYQSFGLVAGMAHAADLVRAFFVFVLSFIIPQNAIRYVVHFILLLAGGLGTYTLLLKTGFNNRKKVFAFLGGLFYILNFGTIQLFYLPYEAFSFFFAFLPWEIWIFISIITGKLNKKNLALLILINFLATPQAYVQTFFLVYVMMLGTFSLGIFIKIHTLETIKKIIVVFLSIFIVNAFWLLPQFYFVKTDGNATIKESKINQLATDDVLFQNKEKGTPMNFLTMKGFYYDLYDSQNHFYFAPWKAHFNSPVIKVTTVLIVGLVLFGVLLKSDYQIPFVLSYIVIAIIFLNSTPLFVQINDFLRKSDTLNQIFRSPFTKFIIPYALVSSFFFSSSLEKIYAFFEKRFEQKVPTKFNWKMVSIGLVATIILIINTLPVFKGYFFSPTMKVSIPKDYMSVMDYFQQQDKNARIALLPEYTFWGWFFTKWGYNGSGFLWYGIEQPIVSRTFDVWSAKSENYYWEMKTALEAEDATQIKNVLAKYDISYLILDSSYLPVNTTTRALQYDRIETLLNNDLTYTKVFSGKQLIVYKISPSKKVEQFVSVARSLPDIGPIIKETNSDTAYQQNRDYFSQQDALDTIYYPFLDFTTQTQISNKTWEIQETNSEFIITSNLPINPTNYVLENGSYTGSYSFEHDKVLTTYQNSFTTQILNSRLEVHIPKNKLIQFNLNTKLDSCNLRDNQNSSQQINKSFIVDSVHGSSACFGYSAPTLDQKEGYLIKIKAQNIVGRKLFFYVLDQTKRQSYLENRVTSNPDYLIIGPHYQYGLGYFLNFQNNSYSNMESKNQLDDLSIYTLPYAAIKNIMLVKKDILPSKGVFDEQFTAKKQTYYRYVVRQQRVSNNAEIILNQAFSTGWQAYTVSNESPLTTYLPFIFGNKIKDHVLVNNWANGWKVTYDTNSVIVLFFWPQYLEFAGIILLIVLFVFTLWNFKLEKDNS